MAVVRDSKVRLSPRRLQGGASRDQQAPPPAAGGLAILALTTLFFAFGCAITPVTVAPPPPQLSGKRYPTNASTTPTPIAIPSSQARISDAPPRANSDLHNDDHEPLSPALTAAIVPPGAPPPPAMGWCLRSRLCELEGLCSAARGDLCIAATNSDCTDSKACLGGRCSARGGVCVAANDQDCRQSWACKGYGRCYFDGKDACKATDADDCAVSTRCTREGECRLGAGVCVK